MQEIYLNITGVIAIALHYKITFLLSAQSEDLNVLCEITLHWLWHTVRGLHIFCSDVCCAAPGCSWRQGQLFTDLCLLCFSK